MYNDFYQEEDLQASLSDFKKALEKNQSKYFEVHEFDFIIEYYLSINDLKTARKALESAQKIHPQSHELRKRKAQILNMNGQYYLAKQEIELAFSSFGSDNDVDYYLILGEALLGMNKYQEAQKAFNQTLYLAREEHVELSTSIAAIYQQKGMHKDAIPYLRLAARVDKVLLFDVALSYQSISMYDKAIHYAQAYLKHDPFSTDTWFLLYQSYTMTDELEKAEDALLNTIAIVPELTHYQYELASFYADNEMYIKALDVYKDILEENKDVDSSIFLSIADVFYRLGHLDKALKNYQNVLTMSPYNAKALYGMALVKIEQEAYDDAFSLIEQAITEEGEMPEYLVSIANIQALTEQSEKAEASYLRILEKYPDFDLAWFHYFDFLFLNGEYERAIAIAKEAFRNGIDKEGLEYKMVAAYCELEAFSLASSLLGKIVASDKQLLDEFYQYYPKGKDMAFIKNLKSD